MTYKQLNNFEIKGIAISRAILETSLAKRMYAVFDSRPLIGTLREFVGLAIEQIVALGLTSSVRVVAYTAALKIAGDKLAVWRGREPSLFNLKKVLAEQNTWSAADCSDLIRLFGGFIELESLQKSGEVGRDVDKFRMAQRPGDNIWDPKKYRVRDRGGFTADAAAPHTAASRQAMLVSRRDPKGFAGITKTGLASISTVKKIDFVFGLPEGCDISGTTADSIFFFRHVNAFIQGLPSGVIPENLVPIIQLLPVATMVSQAHHTLLECALTLTLNGIIKYSIGFYTTLMPPGLQSADLRAAFQTYENHPQNKHVLCYRDPQAPGGLGGRVYTDPSALQRFRYEATVGFPFMTDFVNVGPNPTKDDLLKRSRFRVLLQ